MFIHRFNFECPVPLTFLVIFQGFKILTRHFGYWSYTDDKWGFTIAPFAVIGAFFCLLLVSYFVVDGAFRPSGEDGVLRGVAPILKNEKRREPKPTRLLNGVLDSI